MKKSYLTALAIVALIILWVMSGVLFQSDSTPGSDSAPEPSATAARQDIMTVSVRRLEARPYVKQIIVRGHTEAIRQVELKSQTKGRVENLPAAEGARVEKGDPLCRLAIDDRQANYEETLALKAQRELEYDAARQLSEKGFRSETRVAEARALLDAAIARVARMQVELDHTVLRAPFAGIVNQHYVKTGAYLKEGDSCVLLMEEDPFLVVGDVAEREVYRIRTGAPARARLPDGTLLDGKIRYISAIADNSTRTFRLELEVDNGDRRLRDGVTAELLIPTPEIPAFHISPATLVLNQTGEVGVRTVGKDQTVKFVPVAIMGSDNDGIWITGPDQGAALIIVGQDFVKAGQKVNTAPAEESDRRE